MKKRFIGKLSYVPVAAIMLVSSESFAQAALEEVIVTATRRAESIQDVPLSVSAISGEQLEDLGIVDMEDISLYVPSFEINDASIIPNLYIRGLGGGLTHSIEQSVGRYVDGVYIGRAAINTHGFMDMAGVEVLRGPQGTLFGKNTVAGALLLRTADPTDTFESGINLSAGSYSTTGGTQELQGFVSGPLSDEFSGRIAVRLRNSDGYYINRLEGPDGVDRSDQGIRVKLRWTPNDRFTANLKVERQQYDFLGSDTAEMPGGGTSPLLSRFSPNFTPAMDWYIDMNCADTFATVDGETINTGSFCPLRDSETGNNTLRLDYDFNAGTLTSITAYQTYDYHHQFNGLDAGVTQAFKATRIEGFSGVSQELRFTSDADAGQFDYILGAYYEDSDIDRNQMSELNLTTVFAGTPMGMLYLGRSEPWIQQTESLAGFAQVRWSLSDQMNLIVGGRYSSEDKSFAFQRFFREYGTLTVLPIPGGPGGPPISVSDSRSEGKFTGSITAQWFTQNDSMLYASFAQGHKTGGFSDRIDSPFADFAFDAETSDNFELGAKTTWLDGALLFNATLFHMSLEGLQAATSIRTSTGIGVFSVSNAADTTVQGLESDLAWNVTGSLTVGGNFAYTDATFDAFVGSADCPASARNAMGECDLSGFDLNFAPKTKGSFYADLYMNDAIGAWDVRLRGDIAGSGDTYTDLSYQPTELSPSHTLLNASVRLVAPNENYSITLLGKNLTDEGYCVWCLDGGPASMSRPREISVRFSARID